MKIIRVNSKINEDDTSTENIADAQVKMSTDSAKYDANDRFLKRTSDKLKSNIIKNSENVKNDLSKLKKSVKDKKSLTKIEIEEKADKLAKTLDIAIKQANKNTDDNVGTMLLSKLRNNDKDNLLLPDTFFVKFMQSLGWEELKNKDNAFLKVLSLNDNNNLLGNQKTFTEIYNAYVNNDEEMLKLAKRSKDISSIYKAINSNKSFKNSTKKLNTEKVNNLINRIVSKVDSDQYTIKQFINVAAGVVNNLQENERNAVLAGSLDAIANK